MGVDGLALLGPRHQDLEHVESSRHLVGVGWYSGALKAFYKASIGSRNISSPPHDTAVGGNPSRLALTTDKYPSLASAPCR